MSVGNYAKAIVGALVTGLTAAIAASNDGSGITGYEWTVILGAVLVAAAGIFTADNVKWFRYAKAVTGALIAAVAAFGVALLDGGGVSSSEWMKILVALLTSYAGVVVTPNAAVSDDLDDYNDYDPQDDAPDETVVAGV